MSSDLKTAGGKAIDSIEIEIMLIVSTMVTVMVHGRWREEFFVIKTLLLPVDKDFFGLRRQQQPRRLLTCCRYRC